MGDPIKYLNPATMLSAAGDVLTGAPSMPGAAQPEIKAPAPTPDDLAVKRSRQRRAQRKYAGTGRASTMLSGSDTLG